jgi:hypothetical protein
LLFFTMMIICMVIWILFGLYLFIPMCHNYIIRIEQSNTPLYCLTLTSDYMFRSHDHHQVYTNDIGPVSYE